MYLRDIAYATGSDRVTSEKIAAWSGHSIVFIEDKIGIKERTFLSDGEGQVSLAEKACRRLFEKCPSLNLDMIKLLIVVTQNPDYRIPHSSALLQNLLSLSCTTACFDLNLGCSGYVYGLSIAKSLMQSEDLQNAILVTCDPYSRVIGREDMDTAPLFGDAATATWLSMEKGAKIGKIDFGTDGSGGHNLRVKAGGALHPAVSMINCEKQFSTPREFRLEMNGYAIFKFMMQRVPLSVERCLKKNELTASDVDFYIFHQASKYLLDGLVNKMRLDPRKVPCNLEKLGNTVSSTIPILLSQEMDNDRFIGKNVLVCGFGVGLSWASNVLRFGG